MALCAGHGDVSGARSLDRTLRKFQNRNTRIRRNVPPCGCMPYTSSIKTSWWPAVLSRTVTGKHASDCPYSASEDRLTEMNLNISLCSVRLRRKFDIAVGISQSMIKGTTVRAGLRAITIVRHDSEAFKLVLNFYSRVDEPDSWQGVARELERLFEARLASPHDRLTNGSTLMHVCYGSPTDRGTKYFYRSFA
jgi:hypothetical protein